MRRGLLLSILLLSVPAMLVFQRPASAEEGMWTFDNPPLKQLKDGYGFTPMQTWLDHLRLSCVRLNDGGSGSFVSPRGLFNSPSGPNFESAKGVAYTRSRTRRTRSLIGDSCSFSSSPREVFSL